LQKGKIPWVITALRVAVLPFLILSFVLGFTLASYTLFLFAISTDFLDGYYAKRFNVSSKRGAYFDATADFLFVSAMLSVFVFEGYYSLWILLLVVFVFVQFILTNTVSKQVVYDPVGKYYGSLMYGAVGLTLLFQEQPLYEIVTWGIVVSSTACLVSRAYLLFSRKRYRTAM
jgi:phosphatidylglycerophosphate synthase